MRKSAEVELSETSRRVGAGLGYGMAGSGKGTPA